MKQTNDDLQKVKDRPTGGESSLNALTTDTCKRPPKGEHPFDAAMRQQARHELEHAMKDSAELTPKDRAFVRKLMNMVWKDKESGTDTPKRTSSSSRPEKK